METALTVRTSCLVVIAGVRAIFAGPTAETVCSIPAEAIFNYSRRFRAFEKFAIDYRTFLKRPTGTLVDGGSGRSKNARFRTAEHEKRSANARFRLEGGYQPPFQNFCLQMHRRSGISTPPSVR